MAGTHRASPLIVSQFNMSSKGILNGKLSRRASEGMQHALSYCFRGAHGGWESRGALRTRAGGLILGLPGTVPSFSTFHVENHPVHVEEMSTYFSQCHRDVRQHLNVAVNLFISLDYLHCFLLPQGRVRRAPSLFPGGAQALTQPST